MHSFSHFFCALYSHEFSCGVFKHHKNVSRKKMVLRKSCATNYIFFNLLLLLHYIFFSFLAHCVYSHEFPCCVKLHKKISFGARRQELRQSSCTISCHQHLSHFTLGQVLFLICIVSKLSNDHVKLELFVSIAAQNS